MPTKMFNNLSEAKKNKIIQAAVEEFSEHALPECKVALIMKRANITRASFYNYFESIGDLYLFVIKKLRKDRLDYLELSKPVDNTTFFEFFRALYLHSVEFLLKNPHYIKISRHLWASEDDISTLLTGSLHQLYLDMFIKKINADKANGVIKPEMDTHYIAELFSQISTTVFVYELRDHEVNQEQYEKKVDHLINMVSSGIIYK